MVKKRIIALLLAFCMVLSLPVTKTKAAGISDGYYFFYSQLSAEAKTVYGNLLKSANIIKMQNGSTIHVWSSKEHTFTSEEKSLYYNK